VITLGSFFMLGARGLELFKRDWLPLLIVSVIGVGGFTRLFLDVVNAQAAEAARRDAAELRAVTLLARAAAHEINNALMVVARGGRGGARDNQRARGGGGGARGPRGAPPRRERGPSVGGAGAGRGQQGEGHRPAHEHDHADRRGARPRPAGADARHPSIEPLR